MRCPCASCSGCLLARKGAHLLRLQPRVLSGGRVQAERGRCHRRLHVTGAEEEDRRTPQQKHDSDDMHTEPSTGASKSREPSEEVARDSMRNYVSQVVAPREALRRLTASPGVTGTLAVVAGYLLKLDPFGNLHWDAEHLAVGLACAAPFMLLDAALLLPEYDNAKEDFEEGSRRWIVEATERLATVVDAVAASPSGEAERRSRADTPGTSGSAPEPEPAFRARAGAASDAALVAELRDEVLRLQAELKGRADDMFWRTALAITQTLLMGRAASPVPFAADVALIAAARLGSEMFATSILLTGSAHWVRDRLYEAGLVNALLPSALDRLYAAVRGPAADAAPPLTGAGLWLATVVWASALLGAGLNEIVKAEGVAVGMGQAVEVRALEGPQPLMPSGDSRAKRILRVHLALITLRDLVRLPGICISYIATGAPRSSTGPPVPAAYAVRAGEKAPRGPAPAAEMTKGNLLAPVAGSAVAGAARSGWKRLRIARRGAARRREQERLSGERGARVSWKEVMDVMPYMSWERPMTNVVEAEMLDDHADDQEGE